MGQRGRQGVYFPALFLGSSKDTRHITFFPFPVVITYPCGGIYVVTPVNSIGTGLAPGLLFCERTTIAAFPLRQDVNSPERQTRTNPPWRFKSCDP